MEEEAMQKKYTPGITRKLAFIATFFIVTSIALVSSVFALVAMSDYKLTSAKRYKSTISNRRSGVHVYASLPSSTPTVSGYVISADARVELIRQFLAKYNSPIEPHANFIVQTADKYSLDYRLITAIAMKESGLGKLMPHNDCHNAWGWGIHSAGTLCFETWEEGIETVSKGLKDNYVDIGLVTAEEIMSKYIPHSPGGAWATGVSMYMQQIN